MSVSSLSDESNLQSQFQQLQQQQQKKLLQQKQMRLDEKEMKNKRVEVHSKETRDKNGGGMLFGVDDNLGLKVTPSSVGVQSVDAMEQLREQNRELKDETGRLYKLLSERDLELRQSKKKREEDRALISAGAGSGTSDVAATKIVELSKKVRELTAELETERTRTKQFARRIQEADTMASMSSEVRKSVAFNLEPENKTLLAEELKQTQDRLRQAEAKSAEFRGQTQALRSELKLTQRILAQEVGDGVQIQSLMTSTAGNTGPPNWRGRAQQILVLQKKVNELKKLVEQPHQQQSLHDSQSEFSALEEEMLGIDSSASVRTGTTGKTSSRGVDEKQREQLRKLERNRKENMEKTATDLKHLEQDYEELKQKAEAAKARNKVLSSENKTLKNQTQVLLEKGRHDDELVTALFKQLSQLKQALSDGVNKVGEAANLPPRHASVKEQQENNVVAQLRVIVTDKETRVRELEAELRTLKSNKNGNGHTDSAGINGGGVNRPSSAHTFTRSGSVMSGDIDADTMNHIMDGVLSLDQHSHPDNLTYRAGSSRGEFVTDSSSGVVDRVLSRQQTPAGRNENLLTANDENLKLQLHEISSLYRATTVERDRFAELVQLLEKRNEDATLKLTTAQSDLQAQRRQNALLEKQFMKLKADQPQALVGGGKNKNKRDTNDDVGSTPPTVNVDQLQMRLDIQTDDNEALKAALKTTLRAKEEDLKLYTDMIEETKRVFLQGIRQYKNTLGKS